MIYYKKKIQQDVGATAIEYGILSALIAVVTIIALQATGTNLGTTYCTIANKLSQATGAGATASGCSATPSPSSPNSSVTNSDGTGSGSSTNSTGSCGSGGPCNASNSLSAGGLGSGMDNIRMFANYGVQSMTGIYGADGKEITNPVQFAQNLGISADDYNTYAANQKSYNLTQNYAAKENADNIIESEMAKNPSGNVFIPDMSKVILTTTDVTYTGKGVSGSSTEDSNGKDVTDYQLQGVGNNNYLDLYTQNPTGN